MKQNKETIKSYFETGDRPTQEQYHDTWDSFWHKDESQFENRVVNIATSGTYEVDLSLASKWRLTLASATDITFINKPIGDSIKIIELEISGDNPLLFNDTVWFDEDSDSYNGTKWNRYTISLESDIIRGFVKNLNTV
ncbi:hypothetical protein [Winogradskyella luteola]|uniref:Uncharacterized protein n=1 Tax=Winogradskyella luteola TaxID=2828330 RepID=A0A9X1F890_9FLAO|nr:hypothetical protein [Winogradskyella luteola]MBV7269104.1 hypothetical protein [Winogradskyella luteola]